MTDVAPRRQALLQLAAGGVARVGVETGHLHVERVPEELCVHRRDGQVLPRHRQGQLHAAALHGDAHALADRAADHLGGLVDSRGLVAAERRQQCAVDSDQHVAAMDAGAVRGLVDEDVLDDGVVSGLPGCAERQATARLDGDADAAGAPAAQRGVELLVLLGGEVRGEAVVVEVVEPLHDALLGALRPVGRGHVTDHVVLLDGLPLGGDAVLVDGRAGADVREDPVDETSVLRRGEVEHHQRGEVAGRHCGQHPRDRGRRQRDSQTAPRRLGRPAEAHLRRPVRPPVAAHER